jgi:hypothetical protein
MSRNFGFRPLNRNIVREFNRDRKDTYWAKWKLALDRRNAIELPFGLGVTLTG